MKTYRIILILMFLSIIKIQAQTGTIYNLSIIPPNPVSTDSVKVICNSYFSSGACYLTDSYITKSENSIVVNAYHTIGMLTYICQSIDTLILGQFNGGNYQLIYNITNTVNMALLDVDTINFTVQQITSIDNNKPADNIKIYPNPFNNTTTLTLGNSIITKDITLVIYDVYQRQVKQINEIKNNEIIINKENLKKGIYFYNLINNNKVIKTGKLIID